jgi:thiol:disulfide interchange protein DsbG
MAKVWAKMEKSHWIRTATKTPRTVYLFSDPNCPYCNMFWEQARPWVKAGKVQLRHIMVGIIREDSPASPLRCWPQRPAQGPGRTRSRRQGSKLKPLERIPADIQAQLAANMQLMEDWSCRQRRRFSIWMTRVACSNSKARRRRISW